MSTATLNGHAQTGAAWSTISVREFFEQVPWTGASAIAAPASGDVASSAPGTSQSLSMTLKVGEFFNLFPWEGKPDIAAPMAPMEIQPDLPADDGLTLDGFADLF